MARSVDLEGGLLLGLYLLYIVDNVLSQNHPSASWADEIPALVMLCLVLPVVMVVIFTQARRVTGEQRASGSEQHR